jgi:putative SOS response-associated peptidase YedK
MLRRAVGGPLVEHLSFDWRRMCGRFTLGASAADLAHQFDLANLPAWSPRYNIAPTQEVLAVMKMPDAPDRQARLLRWGLIPQWAGASRRLPNDQRPR